MSRKYPFFAETVPPTDEAFVRIQERRAAEEVFRCEEGRASDASHRATRDLLFTQDGLPGPWLIALAVVCAIVTIGVLG